MNIKYSIFNNNPRSGQSMLLVVLVLSGALLSVAMITGLVLLFQIRQSGDFTNSAEAIYAAETGAEWWRMTKLGSTSLTFDQINDELKNSNGSSFEVFTPVNGNPNQAKIVGTSGNSKRAVLVTVQSSEGFLTCTTEQQRDLVLILDRPNDVDEASLLRILTIRFMLSIMDPPPATANVHTGVLHVSSDLGAYSQVITGVTQDVLDSINNVQMDAGSSFDLEEALDEAINQLSNPPDRNDATAPDAIVIVTESMPDDEVAVENLVQDAKDDGIKVYVINVGILNASDSDYLRDLSSGNNYYFFTPDYNNLEYTLVSEVLGCPPLGQACIANTPPDLNPPFSGATFHVCPTNPRFCVDLNESDPDGNLDRCFATEGLGEAEFNTGSGKWQYCYTPSASGQVPGNIVCQDSCLDYSPIRHRVYNVIFDASICP